MKYLKSETQASDQTISSSKVFQSDWSFVVEPVGISKSDAFTRTGLLEQIHTTSDVSDYLWYSISIDVNGDEPFLMNGTQTNLHIESLGHILHAFVNGKFSGTGTGNSGNAKITFEMLIMLASGINKIDLLSATVGLQNYGAFFDLSGAGITGPVMLKGQNSTLDLSSRVWTYQIGLKGEDSVLYKNSADSSPWVSQSTLPKNQPLMWYKTTFDAPDSTDPVAIDFIGMGKGEAWVNGQSIGRYWPTNISPQNGKPSQQFYHVPRSLIQPSSNTLVLFEEIGGDPTQISFATRRIGNICAYVSELHPAPVSASISSRQTGPVLQLECPYPNQAISSIKFASFGTPEGTCGSFNHGRCSSESALEVVQEACIGSPSCSIGVSVKNFGDPCRGVTKSLAIEAACS